jgi:DNA-directed RNA polymerase specialized sigma24 family protein
MSVVAGMHQAREVEAFYKRWGPDVFVFCRLFLGDEAKAEAPTSSAFLAFYRKSGSLLTTGEVPPGLVGSAFHAMQPCPPEPSPPSQGGGLEKCVLSLDCQQRAAFIMRSVLGMTWPGVASALSLPMEEVRQLWLKGMLRLRELLPRDFFER